MGVGSCPELSGRERWAVGPRRKGGSVAVRMWGMGGGSVPPRPPGRPRGHCQAGAGMAARPAEEGALN